MKNYRHGVRTAVCGGLLAAFALGSLTGCAADRRRSMEARRTTAFDLYNEGERFERAGNYEAALSRYRDALELSERPAFFYKVGRMHHQLGDAERALIYYDQALAMSPDYEMASAHRDLARLELREDAITARAQTSTVVEDEPESDDTSTIAVAPTPSAPSPPAPPREAEGEPAVLEAAPAAAAREADVAEAEAPASPPTEQFTDRAVARPLPPQPGSERTAPRSVATRFEQIELADARRAIFPELFAESREDLAELRAAAQQSTTEGRWSDASLEWSRVVSRDANDLDARLELARAFVETGRTRRGLEEYRVAADLAPENAEVFLRWGNALMRVDRPGEAELRYRQAVSLEPSNVRALNNLGAVTLSQEKYGESLDVLGRLLSVDPEYAPAHLNRALALVSHGGSDAEAIDHLETYLRLGGERQAEAERWLVRLRSGQR